ncbi:SIMPL domain-containing protein [Nostoc sp. UHCC 0302]|uniref:SIMPL domain-containing protein n=1 Tax=Nostoc sp. UHCC 0302 TaxID=3134896 RepID=UPI00311C9CBE
MRKITIFMLLSATVNFVVGSLTARVATAQLFYPPASDRHSLMVIGQGIVKVPADTADIEIVLSSSDDNNDLETQPSLLPEIRPISSPILLLNDKTPTPSSPDKEFLTKASLQPIVNSLVTIGINADKIQVKINANSSENNAKILVKLEKSTRIREAAPLEARVQEIIATVNKSTSKLDNISVKNVGVEYAVNDCQALQSSVYQSAMKDAQNRAQALASAMGVKLGTPSVAEPFYTLLYPSCSSKAGVSLPSFANSLFSPAYDPETQAEVEMKKDIFVTYTVK